MKLKFAADPTANYAPGHPKYRTEQQLRNSERNAERKAQAKSIRDFRLARKGK